MKKRIAALVLSVLLIFTSIYPSRGIWADPEDESKAPVETQAEDARAAGSAQNDETDPVIVEQTLENGDVAVSGLFPVGTTLDAREISNPLLPLEVPAGKAGQVSTLATAENTENIAAWNYLAFYDLKLSDANGATEIQPDGSVKVTIANDAAAGRNVIILHILDDAETISRKLSTLTKVTDKTFVRAFPAESAAAEAATGEVDCVYIELLDAEVDGRNVSFTADSFSVYVIVDDGDNARLEVIFHQYNGQETSIFVKKADTAGSMFDTVLYDPGAGTNLPGDVIFKGWTTEEDYTADTLNEEGKVLTINDLRAAVKAKLDEGVADGEQVHYYALLFKAYYVTYQDNQTHQYTLLGTQDVLFRADDTAEYHSYTVNMAYTPDDNEHNFEGWLVREGAANIQGHTEGDTYTNGAVIRIKGDVILSVDAPEGNWLVFDENGRGATYNAPQFIRRGEVTREPSLEMVRTGYTFAGWYTGAPATENGDPTGTLFEFGHELSAYTIIYAKWTPAATSKVTVIVWKQSVNDNYDAADGDKTYDFEFSTEITAASNTAVASLNLSAYQNKDGQTITVDGEQYNFYAFKYNTAKGVVSNKTTVDPNGTTVVNLYYDREIVTYSFWVQDQYVQVNNPNWNSGETYYVRIGNNYYEASRVGNRTYYFVLFTGTKNNNTTYYLKFNGEWYPYSRVNLGSFFNPDYEWVFEYNGSYYLWDGPIYTRTQAPNNAQYYTKPWRVRETFTGLYGQKLSKYGYTWPTDYRWINDLNGSTFTSTQDVFEGSVNANPISPFHSDFYGEMITANTNVYHFLQNLDGTWPTSASFIVPTIVGNGMVFRNFQGFTRSTFRIKLPNGVTTYQTGTSYNGDNLVNPVSHTAVNGWTDWLPYGTGVEYAGNTRHETTRWAATEGGIEFRYTRNEYPLTFMVGEFVNANDEVQDKPIEGILREDTHINYQESLASYAKGSADYFEPAAQDGYAFEGWFIDITCTIPADFANMTMPMNGTIVYGKWRQIQYRVFFHPNAGTDTTLNWGSETQQMTFRVSYGGRVSVPTGTRSGYAFVGWFTDEACTQAFNAEAYVLNDTTVTTPYDKTVDMTDTMDKWGNGATTNSDLTGYNGGDRFWITRKLDLYGKWRKVLDGAEGIGIIYDRNGGTSNAYDTRLYVDGATATAAAAIRPPAPQGGIEYVFSHWVIQRWNGSGFEDTEETVLPGETYIVRESYASRVEQADAPGYYDYTFQLKAVFAEKEEPSPTHIYWYANNGTEDVVRDEDLGINRPVDIRPVDTFTYANHRFLGWSKDPDAAVPWLVWNEGKDGAAGYWTCEDAVTASNPEGRCTQVAADEFQPYDDLYAVWEEMVTITYVADPSAGGTVRLNSDGSTPANTVTETIGVVSGTAVGATAAPMDGYQFIGWYKSNRYLQEDFLSGDLSYVPVREGEEWTEATYYARFVAKISVTVRKNWSDDGDRDGKRPETLAVTLFISDFDLGDQTIETVNIGADGVWNYTWSGLELYTVSADGTVSENFYDVKEITPDDYILASTRRTVSQTTHNVTVTITNEHTPETVNIRAAKVWDDGGNRDGLRQRTALTLTGKVDGTTVFSPSTKYFSVNNTTNCTWNNLYRYANGKEINYTLTEAQIAGYEAPVITEGAPTGKTRNFTVTNTHVPETIDITVTKIWDDEDDSDGLRTPGKVKLTGIENTQTALYAAAEQTFGTEDGWTYTWSGLYKYVNGNEINYTLDETVVPAGYSKTVSGDKTGGFTVTNKHVPEVVVIDVTKVWADNHDQDGKRPASIIINLLQDGTEILEAAIEKDTSVDEQSCSFESTDTVTLYKYHDHGTPCVYSVTEEHVDQYGTVVRGDAESGYIVENTHDPLKTSVKVNKIWDDNNDQDGLRPDSVTVRLLKDGEEFDSYTLTEAENWTHTWTGLVSYRDHGTVIRYSLEEDPVDLYTTQITQPAATDGDNVSWTDALIINSHSPIKTEIPVRKVWDDDNDRDGIRPALVTVKLLADGEETEKTVELKESEDWADVFTDLDAYKAGQLIVYTVEEVYTDVLTADTDSASTYKLESLVQPSETVDPDTAAVSWSQAVITNKHTPETVTVNVTKVWDDNSNAAGRRPVQIELTITGKVDGETVAVYNETLSGSATADSWTGTYGDLQERPYYKYYGGKLISYSLEETALPDYDTEIAAPEFNAETNTWSFTVNNTAKAGELEIVKNLLSGAYTDDQSFVFHVTGPGDTTVVDCTVAVVVPAGQTSASVKLVQLPVGTYTVTEDSSWSWRWTDAGWTADHTNAQGAVEVLASTKTVVNYNNTLNSDKWLSGTGYAKNTFGRPNGTAALPVDPVPAALFPAPEEEDDRKKRGKA